MEIDHIDIKLFVTVAESTSLTQAAECMHISLSALSVRIKNTEDELGVKLLTRNGHGIALTEAGTSFLQHARLLLREFEDLQDDMQEYASGAKGRVRILANTTAISEFLPGILSTFLLAHPDVNIELRERTSLSIVRAVSEGATDIGIIVAGVPTEGLELIPCRQDRLVLVTSNTHPLARYKRVSFANTLEFDYVGLGEGASIHTFLKQSAATLNRHFKMRVEVANYESVCRLIQTGVGIGVLPESAARRYAKSMAIRIVPLSDDWAPRRLQICVRKLEHLPKLAKELVSLLTADAKSNIHSIQRISADGKHKRA